MANQITDAHLGAAKAIPPKLDKGAPGAALAIGGLHHLIQVAQKAGNAGDVQDAAQGLAPCLEAAEASGGGRPAGTGTGPGPGRGCHSLIQSLRLPKLLVVAA
jgi:hypothetical protein